jgi:hypothetical protein
VALSQKRYDANDIYSFTQNISHLQTHTLHFKHGTGGKSVQWDFGKSSKLPVISPRVMVLRDGPQNLKGGLISTFKLPSEFDLIGKHSQENPAPWDYAEAQLKSSPLPPTSAIFSKSTENFYEDKWYRRTEFNSPERSDPTAMFPGMWHASSIHNHSVACIMCYLLI